MSAWLEKQLEAGVKLELTPFKARNCWKKFLGKVYYLKHPLTKQGYEAALLEWSQIRSKIDGSRPNFDLYKFHKDVFQNVKTYYEQFGVPTSERKLAKEVIEFLAWIEALMEEPTLPKDMPFGEFSIHHKVFTKEFIQTQSGYTLFGNQKYELPQKWQERFRLMEDKIIQKLPQTIEYWMKTYLERLSNRQNKYITEYTFLDRRNKLRHFRQTVPQMSHVSSIDEAFIEKYHEIIDSTKNSKNGRELSKKSKSEYFKTVKMFVRWCHQQTACELKLPVNIDSSEFTFREPLGTGRKREEKKAMLWTAEEVRRILLLPSKQACYLMMMLNCGFRHIDISNLRHVDLRLSERRIVVQRNKLNQKENAPVISYLLWDQTIDLIKSNISEDAEFVFCNAAGGRVEWTIRAWWERNKENFGFKNKRLDYLRKTGSTTISRFDRQLDELYLGESFGTIARIHYSFNDGEPCEALDNGIRHLGSVFGFCDAPKTKIELTAEMQKVLKEAGLI